jgi:ribosomal protein S18 acetylase RimI-like enzyme
VEIKTMTNRIQTIPVSEKNVMEFVRYCQCYGAEHDESFLPDETFVPTDEHPAYLLSSEGTVVGAACLIRTQPYRDKGRARLMILHSTVHSPDAYSALVTAIRSHAQGLSIYGFLPKAKADARQYWEALGFTLERYVYVLAYRAREVAQPVVPEGYDLKHLEQGDDAGILELCDLWNQNYGQQLGFVGATPEYIREVFDNENEYVPGGVLLLRHNTRPVGTAHVFRDSEDEQAAEIGMLSVHPDYRRQGLGRLMLRKSLEVALRKDLHPVYLSVNAANESAVSLYLSEGFAEDTVMACYTLALQ